MKQISEFIFGDMCLSYTQDESGCVGMAVIPAGTEGLIRRKEYRPEPLVQIQEEATVSRTVMSVEGANVVLFTFDKGQELSEHTAAMPVFVQVLKGKLEVTGGVETVKLVPGGLVHFTTRLPHAIRALEPSVMMLTMMTGSKS